MPGLYSNTLRYQNSPIGQIHKVHWQNFAAGVLDDVLFQACKEVDGYCLRKLQAPPTTTVSVSMTGPGSSLTVSNINGIYEGDGIYFPSTGEMILCAGVDPNLTSGGYNGVSNPTMATPALPYTGTVWLRASTVNTYVAGATVQVYRHSQYKVRAKKYDPIDHAIGMSQEAQIAAAHAPKMGQVDSSRFIFFNDTPIMSVFRAYRSLPWSGTETLQDLTAFSIMNEQGWMRTPLGYYNPIGSIWRLYYSSGYYVPDGTLEDATHLYMAAIVSRIMNPMGAIEVSSGSQRALLTQRTHGAMGRDPRPLYVDEAERKLSSYRRKGR